MYIRALLSAVAAVGVWFAINLGVERLDGLGGVLYGGVMLLPDTYTTTDNSVVGSRAAVAFVVAGLLAAVLLRSSPLVAAVSGLVYLGLGVWATFAPASVPGHGFAAAWGYALLLA